MKTKRVTRHHKLSLRPKSVRAKRRYRKKKRSYKPRKSKHRRSKKRLKGGSLGMLPKELQEKVAALVGTPDLARLAQVNRELKKVAKGTPGYFFMFQLRETLLGHSSGILSLTFDHDTKTLFSGSNDKSIKVWTPDGSGNYQAEATLASDKEEECAICLAPMKKGERARTLRCQHTFHARCIDKWFTKENSCPMCREQASPQTLEGHSSPVLSLAYDQESKTLFSGSWDKSIKVWTPDGSGKYQDSQTLEGHGDSVIALIYDQDTKTLFSGSGDQTVKVWIPDGSGNYKVSRTLLGHISFVFTLAFDQVDKTLFSGSGDKSIKVWTPDGSGNYHNSQTLLDDDGSYVLALAFDQTTKTLFSGSRDNTIKVWTRDDSGNYQDTQILTGHGGGFQALTYDHNTKTLFSGSNDQTVKVWVAKPPEPEQPGPELEPEPEPEPESI